MRGAIDLCHLLYPLSRAHVYYLPREMAALPISWGELLIISWCSLRPNSHPVSTWSAEYSLFAKCLTSVLVLSVIGSYLATNDWLRYPAIGMAVVALVVWVLAGLMKVVSQLA